MELILIAFRRVCYIFTLSIFLYFVSWSSILCNIISGVVKYPDKIPLLVWISTLGLLVLYSTFVVAEMSSICFRFEKYAVLKGISLMNIGSVMDRVLLTAMNTAYVADANSIVLVSANMSIDLVCAALYSIPAIRSFFIFDMHKEESVAEIWCISFLLIASPIITISIIRCACSTCTEETKSSVSSIRSLKVFSLYVLASVVLFFTWGSFVMTKRWWDLTNSNTKWIWIALLFVAISFMVVQIIYNTYTKMSVRQPYNLVPLHLDALSETESLLSLQQQHVFAVAMHALLFIGILCASLFVNEISFAEYISMHKDVYSFWPDRDQQIALRRRSTAGSRENTVDYCARRNAMPVYTIMCSLAWTLSSLMNHAYSAFYISQIKRSIADRHQNAKQKDSMHSLQGSVFVLPVLLSMIGFVVLSTRYHVSYFVIIVVPITIIILGLPIAWIMSGFPSDNDDTTKCPHLQMQRLSKFRWIEYSFSATLMHVVVNTISGVLNSHELVALCACFAAAILLVHFIEHEMDLIEHELEETQSNQCYSTNFSCRQVSRVGGLTIEDRVACEKPFIALSFFAKLTLCVALTSSVIVLDLSDFQIIPPFCTETMQP